MCLLHVFEKLRKIVMSYVECVFATFSSNCVKQILSHLKCVYAAFSSNCAKHLESCGMCLLKHGEKTYVFTVIFERETTLTNDGVRRIRSGF